MCLIISVDRRKWEQPHRCIAVEEMVFLRPRLRGQCCIVLNVVVRDAPSTLDSIEIVSQHRIVRATDVTETIGQHGHLYHVIHRSCLGRRITTQERDLSIQLAVPDDPDVQAFGCEGHLAIPSRVHRTYPETEQERGFVPFSTVLVEFDEALPEVALLRIEVIQEVGHPRGYVETMGPYVVLERVCGRIAAAIDDPVHAMADVRGHEIQSRLKAEIVETAPHALAFVLDKRYNLGRLKTGYRAVYEADIAHATHPTDFVRALRGRGPLKILYKVLPSLSYCFQLPD